VSDDSVQGESQPHASGGVGRQSTQMVVLLGGYAPSLVNFRGPLIAALAERGCQVVAMAPDIDDALGEQIRRLGGEPVSISLNRGGLNPAADLASYKALKAEFVRLKPDVLIPYTIKPVIWGTLAARAAGVKAVVPMITGLGFAFTGGVEPRRLISRMMASVLYRLALGKADKVLFQNPDDLATFRSLRLLPGRVPTAIINGSGIDIDHFSPAPLPGEPSFLMIARLLGDKGIREFAAAAARVKKRYPAVPVRLVGFLDQTPDSISQSELDAIIASGVEFLGKMDDVRPAIAGCSVYVLPSYREGTPRSVLEAMAMARAIITTDAPGCRETVVDGQNGWLVPVKNSEALEAAMVRFIENPKLAEDMGRRSRQIAVEKYDVNAVNADIIGHVESVV
jgi:glycosyltransferase involved in cell wall biosynthesis